MLDRMASWAQILTLPVIALTLIFVAWGAWTQHSDYEARTRPYIAIADITANEKDDSSTSLTVAVTNLGERPAMSVQVAQMAIVAGDAAYIQVGEPDDIIVFPGREVPLLVIDVDSETYDYLVSNSAILPIRLDYSIGSAKYWYEADVLLIEGGWSIRSERGN